MTEIGLLGRVHPTGIKISVSGLHSVDYRADLGDFEAKISIEIENSVVRAWCQVPDWNEADLVKLWTHAHRLCTAVVTLVAFQMGANASVHFESWIDPEGTHKEFAFVEPELAPLSTAIGGDLNPFFEMLISEQVLLQVFRDLIAGLANQDEKVVNCARAVEAIRQIVAGYDLEPKYQWPIFNEQLNIGRAYTPFIMEPSKDHRHGKLTPIDPDVVTEIMKRTWTIVDRFFHYRLGGNTKLDLAKFPELT